MPTLRRLVDLLRVTENGQRNSARGKETAGYNGTAQHYKVCIVCNLAGQICVANYGQLLYRRPLVHEEPAFYKAIRLIGSEFVRPQERIIIILLLALSNKFEANSLRQRTWYAALIQNSRIVVIIIYNKYILYKLLL